MDNIPVRQELTVEQPKLLRLLLPGLHTHMDSTCPTQVTHTLPHIVNRHIHNRRISNTLIFREKVYVVDKKKEEYVQLSCEKAERAEH